MGTVTATSATIEELLQILVERGGSDLHLSAGSPPKIRVDGALVATEHEVLRPETVKRLVYSFLSGDQVARFERARSPASSASTRSTCPSGSRASAASARTSSSSAAPSRRSCA